MASGSFDLGGIASRDSDNMTAATGTYTFPRGANTPVVPFIVNSDTTGIVTGTNASGFPVVAPVLAGNVTHTAFISVNLTTTRTSLSTSTTLLAIPVG